MTTPNPCDPREQQLRADYLEALYANSGRCCSTYTGLYRARAHQLLHIDRVEMLLQTSTEQSYHRYE